MFLFAGWDATVYVNEEVKECRVNPGKAALYAVLGLALIYLLAQLGLQGVVSPAKLQANSSSALVFIAQALGGGGWAKVMAFALALSVSASVGIGIVSLARISYGMATRRVLPAILGHVNQRFATPAVASIVMGVILIAITWVYLLSTSIATLFTTLISVDGLLYAAGFLIWIIVKSLQTLSASGRWSLIGIFAAELLVMLVVRFTMRPSFFQTPRERAER